jgi:uncharacterized protein YndB with AHSA1/START domain
MKVGTTADRIVIEYDMGKDPQQIWAALTAPEAIASWWGAHVSLDAKAGGAFREEWTDETGRKVVTSGTVNRFGHRNSSNCPGPMRIGPMRRRSP